MATDPLVPWVTEVIVVVYVVAMLAAIVSCRIRWAIMPLVEIVDMRRERNHVLSERLTADLDENLRAGVPSRPSGSASSPPDPTWPAQAARLMARVRHAVGDAAEIIRRHADRVVYGHLKDYRPEPFAFLPLGEGTVDIAAAVDAFKASSIGEWITVELDGYDGAPIDAAKISKAYLASLGLE